MIKFVVTYRIYNAAGYTEGRQEFTFYKEAQERRWELERANDRIGFAWYEDIKLTEK